MLLEKSENLRLRCQDLWYKVKNRPSIRKVQTKSSWKKTAGSVRTHDGRGSVWSRPWRNTFWARANERRGWEHIVKTWPVELCTVQGCLGDQCAWRCWSEDHLCSGTWWGEVSAAPWLWNTLHLLNSACSVSGIPSEWNFFLIFFKPHLRPFPHSQKFDSIGSGQVCYHFCVLTAFPIGLQPLHGQGCSFLFKSHINRGLSWAQSRHSINTRWFIGLQMNETVHRKCGLKLLNEYFRFIPNC